MKLIIKVEDLNWEIFYRDSENKKTDINKNV
jgi:hypothetical protein